MALVFNTVVTGRTIRNVLVAACSADIACLGWVALILLGALICHAVVTGRAIWNVLVAACCADIACLGWVALVA